MELVSGDFAAHTCPRYGFLRHRVTHVICGSDLRLCGDADSSGRVTGQGGALSHVTRVTRDDTGFDGLRHRCRRWSGIGFVWLVTWVTQRLFS